MGRFPKLFGRCKKMDDGQAVASAYPRSDFFGLGVRELSPGYRCARQQRCAMRVAYRSVVRGKARRASAAKWGIP
jgi:hypothetical protein